ncbi:MAG TPA: hypothetical protein VKR32_03330 [Puia sp.]|nr:hypothetical protein [Puia sp.]
MHKRSLLIFLSSFLVLVSCNKTASSSHHVGDHFGGGIIFYIDSSGQHGLVASMFDLAVAGYGPWGLPSPSDPSNIFYPFAETAPGNWVSPLATDTSIMSGDRNCALIDSFYNNGTDASDLVRKLTLNGYNDWFMPSSGAAREICKEQQYLGAFNDTAIYWTSTIISPNNSDSGVAYFVFKNNYAGVISYTCACCSPDKCCSSFGLVRPVRKF